MEKCERVSVRTVLGAMMVMVRGRGQGEDGVRAGRGAEGHS